MDKSPPTPAQLRQKICSAIDLLEQPHAAPQVGPSAGNHSGEDFQPAVAAPVASSPIEGTSTIPSSYAADARLILKAKGWKEPEKYSDTDAIKRLLLDNAATMALDPSGWDLGISKEIQPDLERIASETRRAAHADLRIASSTARVDSAEEDFKQEILDALAGLAESLKKQERIADSLTCTKAAIWIDGSKSPSSTEASEPVAWLYEAEGFSDAFSKKRLPLDAMFGNPKETPLYAAPVARSATGGKSE